MDKHSRNKVLRAGLRIFRIRELELAIYELTAKGGWKKVRQCDNKAALSRVLQQVMSDEKAIID